jgi:diadenosine tetraphosphate (Ap4A) HIT family hydrolase
MTTKCLFCNRAQFKELSSNKSAYAIYDNYPVFPGHILIITKRHISSWFDISSEEKLDMLAMIDSLKKILDSNFKPDGFNIAINDGIEAGQTILHLHIHLIPRYKDDVQNKKGGIRWINPAKAEYWD